MLLSRLSKPSRMDLTKVNRCLLHKQNQCVLQKKVHPNSMYGALQLSCGVSNVGKRSLSTCITSLAPKEYNDDNFDEVHSPYSQQLKSLVKGRLDTLATKELDDRNKKLEKLMEDLKMQVQQNSGSSTSTTAKANNLEKPAAPQGIVNKFLSVVKYPFSFAPIVLDWSVKATLFAFSAVFYTCVAMVCLKVSWVLFKFFFVFATDTIAFVYDYLFD